MIQSPTIRRLALIVAVLGLAFLGQGSAGPSPEDTAESPGPRRDLWMPIPALDPQMNPAGPERSSSSITAAAAAGIPGTPATSGTTMSTPPAVSTTPAEPTSTTGTRRETVVINAVGDVSVDPGYIPAFLTEGFEHALTGMGGLFLDDDLTVINLECPASDKGDPKVKEFVFRCDPAALAALKRFGVDVANQGNNHSLDYGPSAMLDSLANLEAAGIAPVGAGANADGAALPALLDRRGWTVAVVGFGGVVPAADWIATEDRPGMADGDDVESMVAAVAAADKLADIVAVTIHWGVELQAGPPADDVVRAHALIDAGADMVFGHHPHRLNGLDWYQGRPIFWSLGNFVWPRLSAAGSDTAVAHVLVDPDGSVSACFLDVTIVSDGHPELDDPTNRTCTP